MSEPSKKDQARDVLWDFHEACPVPTADDVRRWQETHPEHADLIMECAQVTMEDALDEDLDGEFSVPKRKGRESRRSGRASM